MGPADVMSGTLVDALLVALEAFGLASGVARSAVRYAGVSTAHVLGIALLVGPVLLADLRLAGLPLPLDASAMRLLRRTAAVGVAVSVLTGVALFSARPFEYAGNGAMLLKLGVVGLAVANALLLEWAAWAHRAGALPGKAHARSAAIASLTLWLAALVLGRWVAFV